MLWYTRLSAEAIKFLPELRKGFSYALRVFDLDSRHAEPNEGKRHSQTVILMSVQ